jgi:hypothetical protein
MHPLAVVHSLASGRNQLERTATSQRSADSSHYSWLTKTPRFERRAERGQRARRAHQSTSERQSGSAFVLESGSVFLAGINHGELLYAG